MRRLKDIFSRSIRRTLRAFQLRKEQHVLRTLVCITLLGVTGSLGAYLGDRKFDTALREYREHWDWRRVNLGTHEFYEQEKGRRDYRAGGALLGGMLGFLLWAFIDGDNWERRDHDGMRGID